MSSSRAPAIPLSLTCCWGWKLPEDRTIPVASQQETCEQMMEEVVMQCGPRASGVPALALWVFPRQLCRSAGMFVCEWSKQNFSKGGSLQNTKSKQLGRHGSSGHVKAPLALGDL